MTYLSVYVHPFTKIVDGDPVKRVTVLHKRAVLLKKYDAVLPSLKR